MKLIPFGRTDLEFFSLCLGAINVAWLADPAGQGGNRHPERELAEVGA